MSKFLKTYIRYPLEFFLFIIFYTIFKILPLTVSRKLGVFFALLIGPLFSVNKIIEKNLKYAFKDKDDIWIKETVKKVWVNFGYTIAEYSHLKNILHNKVNVVRNDLFKEAFESHTKSIIVSAHNSNWEIPGMSLRKIMHPASAIVREPNNPLINFVLKRLRNKYSLKCLSKNREGTRQLLSNFKKGESIALLADLQLSSGIEIDFFDRKMKFSTLPAQLALKSKCKIFLGWPIRKTNGSFEFEIHEAIYPNELKDNQENIVKISKKIISYYESMIEKYPDQYFWFHNRWKIN